MRAEEGARVREEERELKATAVARASSEGRARALYKGNGSNMPKRKQMSQRQHNTSGGSRTHTIRTGNPRSSGPREMKTADGSVDPMLAETSL
ncbi:hypothetical protein NDU88_005904 [Pleurodeles waltl]|uniref:Uncharacterized protein n=1 Tax=Pleurodeles waltl TaxID=8319 RepID=A0AAV7MCL1_PLEWA|nr:hypothetical protein NDU88_005904 [Pleurodeles waltl]